MTTPLTFLGIGAYKSGTTSLHQYFRAHPEVYVPSRGEPSYFAVHGGADPTRPPTQNACSNPAEYRALFDAVGSERAVGEISPEYLASPLACARIQRAYPRIALVAVLRNPIERAYSDYLMNRRLGREPEADFSVALDEQEERARRRERTGYYISTGFYASQLEPYYDAFDSDRIGVWLFEDLVQDTPRTLRQICEFLGIDPGRGLELPHHNLGGVPKGIVTRWLFRLRPLATRYGRSFVPKGFGRWLVSSLSTRLARPPLPEACRNRLARTYGPEIERLAKMLSRDLSHWIDSGIGQPATPPDRTAQPE